MKERKMKEELKIKKKRIITDSKYLLLNFDWSVFDWSIYFTDWFLFILIKLNHSENGN